MPNKETDLSKSTGRRLKLARRAVAPDLSQVAFAATIGLGKTTYGAYETGQNLLDVEVACKIKSLYKITLDWLYAGDADSMRHDMAKKVTHPTEVEKPPAKISRRVA